VLGQGFELGLPVFGVAVEPERRVGQRLGVEAAAADAARTGLGDQTGADQDLDMARDRLQRDVEGLGELGNQKGGAVQPLEDGAAHRIAEREEDRVQAVSIGIDRRGESEAHAPIQSTDRLIVNRSVDDSRRR
jgi:hypothetical protein